MISDPLVALVDIDEAYGARDGPRVFQHEKEQLSENLLRQVVDEVVFSANFTGQGGIAAGECIHRSFEPAHSTGPAS
jgi:hypothetical protein